MGVKINDIITELTAFPLRCVCGDRSAEFTRSAGPDIHTWQEETLHILPADKPLPDGTPPAGSSLILLGASTLPEQLADCDNINVLLLPDAERTQELIDALDLLFSDEIFISGAASRIYEAMLRRHSPQAVLDAANASLNLPIVISDYTHSIIAHTCPPELYGEPDWDSYIAHGVVPEFMGEDGSRLLEVICETPAGSLRLTHTPKTGVYNLIGDMIYEGESFGRISMLLPHGRPTRRERRILAVTHEVLSTLIGSNPEAGFVRGDMMDAFLLKLIEGGTSAEQFFISSEHQISYPHRGCFRVMVMDLESHKPFKKTMRSIISYLELICPGTISAVAGKTLVMLTNYSKRENFAARDETELERFVAEYLLFCGASREFYDMRHFIRAYTEAVDAMEISRYINHPSPDTPVYRIAHYDKTESLIEANRLYRKGEDLAARCHPHVFRLREYDKEFGSSYYETLQIYLECSMKTQLAAKKLCLHRNSLEYRLRKIKAITGLDWDDGDLMMRLLRSFVYLDFLHAATGRDRFLRDVTGAQRIT